MKRHCIIYCLLILGFFVSCEKKDSDYIDIHIETISQRDYNYRYDDLKVIYQIQSSNQREYKLQCRLLDDTDSEIYMTNYFDTIDVSSSTNDTVSLREIDWNNSSGPVDFYSIENKSFRLQFLLITDASDEKIYQSNKLIIDINRRNPDTSLIDNFTLYNINGNKYELVKQLEKMDYVFIFEFATWCHWSRMSIAQVNQIDSLFGDKINVIGVEGSNPAPDAEYLNKFITDSKIKYTVFLRVDNIVLNDILHPDNILSFPRILMINKDRRLVYRQVGYQENMIDSIEYYINKN